MRKVILALVILFMALPVFGQFRDTEWGMSKDEVVNTEGRSPQAVEGNVIGYKGTLSGYTVYYYYQFTKGKLTSGWYYFATSYGSPTMYVREYKDFKKTLINIYGEPDWDRRKWFNDNYRNVEGMLGTALQMGHVTIQCGWENDITRIIHTLGNSDGIIHIIKYRSMKYLDLEKRENQKQNQEGL